MTSRRTIIFFPEAAYGPTLNCVGIGDVLKQKGARVVFVVAESFKEVLGGRGFEVAPVRLEPKPQVETEADQFWKDFIRETAPHFRDTTFGQIETLTKPIWEGEIVGSLYAQDQLKELFNRLKPDAIVQDNVIAFPAIHTAGAAFIRIISCNPAEIRDPQVPPTFSGLPANDRSQWSGFMEEYRRAMEPVHRDFNEFVKKNGCPPLGDLEFMFQSEYLNLYLYPKLLDYQRANPLPATFHRLDSCARSGDSPFQVPNSLGKDGALIYVSMGSLGSLDLGLMNRLINSLKETRHRFIVSLGPQAAEIELPDNFYGEEFLPQPSVLPQVDVVITHGGNNTVTESFHFGKPMVLLPLFWDQHDNAQRVHECGYGIRLSPYTFTDGELHDAIEELLTNRERGRAMAEISKELQARPGTLKAAEMIYQVADQKQPIPCSEG
ncbi:MAG: glycosyltransferase [Dehalococcoidia bacterium]